MIIPLKTRFLQLSDDEFYLFCQEMRDFQIERDANGTILIMSPTGSKSGNLNFEIALELGNWNRKTKLGIAFDSSTGFTFPNKAVRSPDVCWIAQERWNALSKAERERFAPIVPDFVIEIRSLTDDLDTLKDKMLEYVEQGARLGWLVDPSQQQVWIYRANGTIDQVTSFEVELSGESVLPEFSMKISDFWKASD